MNLYIVIVGYKDIDTFSEDYLNGIFSNLGKYVRLKELVYLLRSDASAVDIRDTLVQEDTDITNIFVANCASPSAWRGMDSTNDEIKSILRNG